MDSSMECESNDLIGLIINIPNQNLNATVENDVCAKNESVGELSKLINSWDLTNPDFIYNTLTDAGLGIKQLKIIQKHHVDILIPNSRLLDRIEFEDAVQIWKRNNFTISAHSIMSEDTLSINSDVTNQNFSVDSSSSSSSPQNLEELEKILSKSKFGKILLDLREDNLKKLSDNQQKIICDAIVKQYIDSGKRLSHPEMAFYANEIKRLFSNEIVKTYYQKKRSGNPKGKLFNRQRNLLTKVKQQTSNEAVTKKKKPKPNEIVPASEFTEEKEIQIFLKRHTEPWHQLEDYWQKTSKYRTSTIQNLADTLLNWPLLKDARAASLYDIDFEYLFPSKKNNLFRQWDIFKETCVPKMLRCVKDLETREKLMQINNSSNEDDRNLIILYSLHALAKPTARISYCKSIWRPSIIDSQIGQIQIIDTLNNLENIIQVRTDKYISRGLQMQPFVYGIKCAATTTFYVYVDNFTSYKCENLLNAIDLCFKVYNTLNLKYSRDCEQVWEFIQKYFYGIETIYDQYPQSSDLKAFFQ